MVYRDILVHIPLLQSEAQLEVGVMLAKQFGAHLTGICSLPETAMLRSAVQNPFLRLDRAEVDQSIQREYEEAAVAEERFNAAAKEKGVSHSWLIGEGDAADLIIHACRLEDLAVVEQCAVASDLLWGPAVQLALSGHPALIIPRSWLSPVFPRCALVAWNGSAQSATAVRKALPLLIRAEHVTLLIGVSRAAFPTNMRVPPLDIVGYLQRNGVRVVAKHLDVPDAEAGAAILKAAEDIKADLIVMGAFGRSRFSEWVLGGATRHVLEHMTVPVFMAH